MPTSSLHTSSDILRTRVSLLGRARDGQSDLAWEELLRYYEPFVSRVLQGMGFQGANLDDARQQVSIQLWNGLKSYKRDPERAKFRSWFACLIRNTARNILRSQKRQPHGPSIDDDSLRLDPLLSDEAEIDAKVEQEWQRYVVDLAMERVSQVFSGKAVEVFQLSLKGIEVRDIASQLHLKPNTVYILKHRVKAVLLKEIKQLKLDLESFGDSPSL